MVMALERCDDDILPKWLGAAPQCSFLKFGKIDEVNNNVSAGKS